MGVERGLCSDVTVQRDPRGNQIDPPVRADRVLARDAGREPRARPGTLIDYRLALGYHHECLSVERDRRPGRDAEIDRHRRRAALVEENSTEPIRDARFLGMLPPHDEEVTAALRYRQIENAGLVEQGNWLARPKLAVDPPDIQTVGRHTILGNPGNESLGGAPR